MDQQAPPFEIKNFRLGKILEDRVNQQNPLQSPANQQEDQNSFIYKSKKYHLTKQFGTAYIGTDIISVGSIRYLGNTQLEYVNIEFVVTLEKQKTEIIKNALRLQNITHKNDIKFPTEFKLESKDNYIFCYKFTYKELPFLQGSQTERQNLEQKWQKKFRIQPQLPFEIHPPRLCPWLAPNYFLEYPFVNVSGEKLVLRGLGFKPENPFEAVKVQSKSEESQNDEVVLLNQEKENIIFKISVKPNMVQAYEALFKNLSADSDKSVNLGSLFLQWGSCGVYVGASVPLKITSNDLALDLVEEGQSILDMDKKEEEGGKQKVFKLEKIQKIKMRLYSPTQKVLNLKLYLKENDMDNIKVVGSDKQTFELSPDQKYQEITFYILPLFAGIQVIKGIYFINQQTHKAILYKNGLYVMVQPNCDIFEYKTDDNNNVDLL